MASLKVDAPYLAVRSALVGQGWRPVVSHIPLKDGGEERLFGDARLFVEAGIDEVETCSGTGPNYCVFNLAKGKQCLRITTAGEYGPRSGSPRIVKWTRQCEGWRAG